MRYAVIGTGAVGGYYGACLAHSGQEVHFLLHRDYEYVREHGLQVNSWKGSFHLDSPLVYDDSEKMPPCDIVIVGLKTTKNRMLLKLLPPLLKPDTLVLLVQNGVGVEDDVQEMFPDLQLAAGLAFICSAKTEPGVVDHQHYGSLTIGNYSCRDAGRIEALVADLKNSGVDAAQVGYLTARWRKAVWNMPFNGMTVALHCQTDQLLAHSSTRRLIRQQMMEIVWATRAMNIEGVDEDFVEQMIQTTEAMVPYKPSMRLDWDFGRPMELDYLYTRPLELARKAGSPMPCLEMLEAELRFMEENKNGTASHSLRSRS